MSSMLDEAIIDAEALREAALKSAESTILEKYSNEIKSAVSSLLHEQEEPMMEEPMMEDPMMGDQSDAAEEPPDVPPAEGLCDCPDLDGPEDGAPDPKPVNLTNVAMTEEIEVDFAALEKELLRESDALEVELDTATIDDILEESDEFELSDLQEIVEELTVDIDPQKSGWLETPIADINLAVAQAEAAESPDDDEDSAEVAAAAGVVNQLNENLLSLNEENDTLNEQIVQLSEQNQKAKEILTSLKNKLGEVNFHNAKLLYTNRILSNPSLNERQKSKIVESLSNAKSVEETKVMYETLQSTVGVPPDRRRPETLSEVVSRNSSTRLPRRESNETQTAPAFNRMKKLAGIT